MAYLYFIVLLSVFLQSASSQISNFSNPVLDITITERDAAVIRIGDFYYLAQTNTQTWELLIWKSSFLTDFRNAEKEVIYTLPPGYRAFHPNNFFKYQDELYLYFHMDHQSTSYRVFAMKADNYTNPMGGWSTPVRVLDHIWNETSQHGAPFELNNQLFFVWSGYSGSRQSLYVAKMTSPIEASEPIVLLREPTESWECHGACTLQGASFLYNRDKVYMVFSASQSQAPETSITYMSIQIELDPMNKSNWDSAPGPVFQGNAQESVYSTRFPELTTSPDGTETWMLYTASSDSANLAASSRIRIEKINWDSYTGSPIFPMARANGFQQQLPCGEPFKYYNPLSKDIDFWSPNALYVFGSYYTVSRTDQDTKLILLKSEKLYDYSNAEISTIYTAAEGFIVNSGRMFAVGGEFYIYFFIQPPTEPSSFYVLKAENVSNLMQNWGTPTKLEGLPDGQKYYANILEHNGQNYFVWDHRHNGTYVAIYIAAMRSPVDIVEPIVLLKAPKHTWECNTQCINEHPAILRHNNTTFVVFGVSFVGHVDASLSFMSIEDGKDPLDVTNWYTALSPVFTKNPAENVYATGRAGFTTSPDGLEDWMMYMASYNATDVWGSRSIRIQKISWDDETKRAVFPKAHGYEFSHAIPSSFEYFNNPVIDSSSVSPAVTRVGDFYYMLLSGVNSSELGLLKSGKLTDFRNSERQIIYSVPDDYSISGSSKMQVLNGQLYIYFSMERQNSSSQLFVMQANDPTNPMGVWSRNPIPLASSWSYPAFHSTVLEHWGNLYLVWVTPHPATGYNSIFIAEMINATYVVEPFNLIRNPIELWECDGGCSDEAPYFIYNNETTYMVHSVGSACKGGNALTYMSIEKANDPMNVVNWNKASGKVFSESLDESVFCPSHASFTVSPDGKETWMVYHATDSPHPDAVKSARIEKVTWNLDTGETVFPEPHGHYHQQVIPSRRKYA